jgi:hypothetical protein
VVVFKYPNNDKIDRVYISFAVLSEDETCDCNPLRNGALGEDSELV